MKAFVLFELMNQMVLVAQEAKARGFHVVALNHDPLRDSGDFAVPEGVVDELLHVESWSDGDAVRALLDKVRAAHEIAGTYAGFEHTLAYETELREHAGLPRNGVRETLLTLDKGEVRRKLYAEGLSRLRSVTLTEALGWEEWRFDGPAVLKPTHGTGSALCYIVSTPGELREAAAKAEAADVINPLMKEYILGGSGFVLEEKAEGELLSVESLVHEGTVHHVGLTGRYVLAENPVVEQGLFFPYDHPRRAEIIETCDRFHRSLGIFHGPTHLEVMVPDDGPVELIDFNLRFAGLAATVLVNEAFGLPFEAYLADVACGVEPDMAKLGEPTRCAADVLVMPPPGVREFRDLTFPAQASTRRLMKKLGQRLTGRSDQLDAVAMFTVSGDTPAETHAKVLEARRETVFNGAPLGDVPATRVAFGGHLGGEQP